MRVLGIVMAVVALILCCTTPAAAEVPYKIILSGGPLSHTVTITDLRDTGNLTTQLCSAHHAGVLTHRPAITITIQWFRVAHFLVWTGRFYPAIGAQAAAVDIPHFKLYWGNDTVLYCDRRVAGAPALALLKAYHVPTRYPYEICGPGRQGVLSTPSLRDCRSSSAGFASASEHNP